MDKIRLGLIGCGGMANAHVSRFDALWSRLTLVAAADIALERAQAVAALSPGTRALSDYREMLDDVDAVLIALPHHLHHPVAKACLLAGKHVLLEKPMAISEAECLDLIKTSEDVERTLMIAYCMRFHPLAVRLKELLDARALGDVFQVSLWTEQLTQYYPGHWALNAAMLGGGQLFSHGCHYIDLLLWYLGQPIRGTHLGTNFGTPWMEREGTSNVSIEFAGGRLGYHFGTWGARGTRLHYSFHAHCTDGMLEAYFPEGRLVSIVKDKEELLLQCESGKHTQNEMAHFLDCVETGKRPLTDGPGSLQGLRVIWKLYEAEQQGVVADLRGLGLDEYRRSS